LLVIRLLWSLWVSLTTFDIGHQLIQKLLIPLTYSFKSMLHLVETRNLFFYITPLVLHLAQLLLMELLVLVTLQFRFVPLSCLLIDLLNKAQ